MVEKQSTSLPLTPWDVALLLGVCVAPAYGGGAAFVVLIASLVSIALMLHKRPMDIPLANWILTAIFFLYFLYFFLQSAFIGGDFSVAYGAMKGNLPVVFVAILCIYMGGGKNNVTAFQVGHWATIATLTTFGLAIFLYVLWAKFNFMSESRMFDELDLGGRLRLLSRNALMFGSMYTTLSFISLLGYPKKSTLQKISAIAALIVGLGVVALWTQSRGALLAAIPLGGLALWYIQPKFVKILMSLFCLAVILATLYFTQAAVALKINALNERLYAGMLTAQDATQALDASTSERMLMYQLGVQAIKDAPLLGYGFQNRFDAIIPYFQSDPPFLHGHLHNTFISHTVAGGLIGCIVLFFYILTPLIVESLLKPKSNDIRYLTWVIIIVMIGIGMTTEILGHLIHASFFSTLILMHLIATLNEKNYSPHSSRDGVQRSWI